MLPGTNMFKGFWIRMIAVMASYTAAVKIIVPPSMIVEQPGVLILMAIGLGFCIVMLAMNND